MPNHIKHNVEVSDKFKEIVAKMKSKESEWDFNNIIPMPESLRDTRSPSNPIENHEEYQKELAQYEIDKLDPQKYASKPISLEQSKKYIKFYGADNWYDWSIKNWGTKWNAYDILIENAIENGFIEFETAWSTPLPVMIALSKEFPDVVFTVKYADEDIGSNCGTYELENGEIISDEYGNDEFACGLWGYDYQEYLQEIEDNK